MNQNEQQFTMDQKIMDNMEYLVASFKIAMKIDEVTVAVEEEITSEKSTVLSFKTRNGVIVNVSAGWLICNCKGKNYDYVRTVKACRTGLGERIMKRFGLGEMLNEMIVTF